MTLKRIAAEKRLPADLSAPLDYGAQAAASIPPGDDLTEVPAFGMWADRDDMEDTTAWVKNLRRGRYCDI
jgi:antitoxin component of RelBE/YafQ-DinJ toxin-antitoxin module